MAWEQNNGCSGERAARSIANGITEEEGRGCASDTRLVVVEGGGHTWPGGVFVAGLGETTKDLSAAEFIWQFFASVRPGGSSP
jgi:polyhydroxybutyrate depolymerase